MHLLKNIITDPDLVLIISVNPGFGKQKFINAIEEIKELKQLITEKKPNVLIEVDVGVDHTNAKMLVDSIGDIFIRRELHFWSRRPAWYY